MKIMGKTYVTVFALILCGIVSGCGSGKLSNNLVVTVASGSVTAGGTAQLKATRGNDDGTVVDVTTTVSWVSSEHSVATVNSQGLLSALITGTTSITATVGPASGSVTVAVGSPALTALSVSPVNTSVPSGYTQQFSATATYANAAHADATSSVTWSVTPATTASIDKNGLLLGKSPGAFTVTATAGSVTASATGTTTNALLTSLTVTPTGASVQEGATQQFTASATFSDLTVHDVSTTATWSSANTNLLQISSKGLATAQKGVAAGSTTVYAQVGTLVASAPVNVVPAVVVGPALTALIVTPTSSSVAQHTGTLLKATGYYADGSQQDVSDIATWTTNNAGVSAVNSIGLVTTGSPGASTIQASITPSSSLRRLRGYATTALQSQSVSLVTPATLVSVVASFSNQNSATTSLSIGTTQQLILTGLFSDGTQQDLTALATWQSQEPAIATVNAQGVVTAVSLGSVTFTGSFGGKTSTTPAITITDAALLYATLSSVSSDIVNGVSIPLMLTGHFSDGSTQDLTSSATFQSSKPSVISVNAQGEALGITPGNVLVTASALGQAGTFAMVDVDATLQSITIIPGTGTFAEGTTQAFRALGNFSDGGSVDISDVVVWGSTSPTVFTIGSTGVAKAGNVGSASVTASLLGITAVSGAFQVSNATLESLIVSPAYLQVPTTASQQFHAIGIFSNGTTQDVTSDAIWTSSSPAVVQVNPTGFANDLTAGNATITATLLGQSGSTQQDTVVAGSLQSVAISPQNPTIAVNTSEQLHLLGTYSDGSILDLTSCALWTSSAPGQTYLNLPGLVNGVSDGTSTITATCGANSASTTVITVVKSLSSIALQPVQAQEAVGNTTTFALIGTFADGTTQEIDQNVVWGSSSPIVATLSGDYPGSAIGVTTGNTNITATYGGLTAPSAILHVTSKPLSSLAVTPATPTLAAGATQQFTAQATYTDNTGGDISNEVAWTSSNPSLLSVNASGLATAQSNPQGGTATITATTGTFVASTTVTISPNASDMLTALTVVPTSSRVAAGTPQQLVALGTYTDGTTRDVSSIVTWTSSDPSTATVSTTGLAEGVAPGTATLLAQTGMLQSSSTLIVTAATLVSVAISPSGATFANGTPEQFQLIGTFSDGTTQILTGSGVNWVSSNPAVATISGTGLAMGTGVGAVELSGTFDGQTATTPPVQVTGATLVSIAVQPNSISYAKGVSQQFHVTGSYSDNTTQDLTSMTVWSSSDTTIVNISSTGLGTGVGEGAVTVQGAVGGLTATSSVQVTAPTLTSIAITPANPHIAAGTNQAFTAIGTFSDGTTENLSSQVIWTSSNPSVATINQYGVAESDMPGSTQFTASYQGVMQTTGVITISQAVLTALNVTLTTGTLAKGTTEQITATGTFSDGSTEDLTDQVSWSSSSPAISINQTGLATAVSTGTAQVTATSGSLTASTGNITVTAATLSSVAVTPAAPSIGKGTNEQFTLTGTFSDGSTQNLSGTANWSSSNTTVASINSTGLAAGLTVGMATITGQSGSQSATAQLTVTAATLTSITVSPNSASFAKGTTLQFTATGTYSDGSTQDLTNNVTWTSADTGTISIGANGVASAISVGSTQITAASGSVYYVTSAITVTPPTLASIGVSPSTVTITPSTTQQFRATGTYTDASTTDLTTSVTWSSSASSVATINTVGVATAGSLGNTTITAQDGSLSGTAALTVATTAATPQSLTVTPSSASISNGAHQQFAATVTYSDGTTADVTSQTTWSSATPAVATINSSGLATGVSGGSTQITGTYNLLTNSVVLTVSSATLTSIAVTPASASIVTGTTQQYTATGTLSDGSTENLSNSVSWLSSNADATINASGLATGQAAGSATITAQAAGMTSNSATLTVTTATVLSLQVQPSSVSLAAGNTQQLTVTATFSNLTSQNVTNSSTYASSSPNIATVSAGGLITSLVPGSTTITVSQGGTNATVPVTVTSATLQSIAVTPTNLSLAKGVSQQLTATGTYSDGSTAVLTNAVAWSSSATANLTVSSTGDATAVQPGNATVTAQLNGISGTLPVTVTNAVVNAISVTPGSTTLAAGQTQQYTAIATFSDGTQQTVTTTAHWSVSDPTRASISNTSGQNGLLTSIESGVDTVTAAVGSVSGTASVTITTATLSSLTITPAAVTLTEGATQQLSVAGTYSDGSSQDLTNSVLYASSSPSAGVVSSTGLVTATGTGVSTITATDGSVSASATLTSTPAVLLAIAVTPATQTVANGLTQQFTATGTYVALSQENITNQVQWTSSHTGVATINTNGLAQAVGAGTTTITATSGTMSGTATLTVGAGVLQSITVQATQNTFARGQEVQLTAIGNYSDGTTQNLTTAVTWTSLNTAVGVVSSTGIASGVTAGEFGAQATLSGISGSTPLTVTNATLTSIVVTPNDPTIVDVTGTVEQFIATGHFSDGTTQVLTLGVHWSLTSNLLGLQLATISQQGVLSPTAVGAGTVVATYGTISGNTAFVVVAAPL